jgi:hypothetical protein
MIDLECKRGNHKDCTQPTDCPCQHRNTVEILDKEGRIYTAPEGVTQIDTGR